MQGLSELNRELLDASALCRQLVPEGSVEAFLADHRHELFPDEMFEDLFPTKRGRPSIPADTVASVMVLQALEGLSDRDAARALTDRISWKVACGLALDEAGFDYSVLTYWRTRLRHSQHPERIFEAVRSVIEATGVLRGKTRRALDSTLLDDAVATQDTVTQLVAAIRRVRRVVAGASELALVAHDYDTAAKPTIAWDDDAARAELVDALVSDALRLLDACADPDDAEASAALGLLALVAGQDVELDEQGHWRIVRGVAKDRVISVVDPETRHMHKSRSDYRDGYKAHLSVEPETGLITGAALTPASTPDGPTGVTLLAGEAPGLQVLADGAYGSGDTLAALGAAGHERAIKPHPSTSAVPGGFHRDDFIVDEAHGTVTCPQGHVAAITPRRHAVFGARCATCPLRSRCTTARQGRTLKLTEHDAELVESRRAWRDGDFISDYRKYRPMVERSIAWLVKDHYRRVRFRGVEKNQMGLSTRVAAINLRRLINLGLVHDGAWRLASTSA
ncbi:MAG: IS1182 family transposase [Acidimicrobiaceae bacterium]|nr:IS1182 family transposase [Acidimicrobiaceae bacterium]